MIFECFVVETSTNSRRVALPPDEASMVTFSSPSILRAAQLVLPDQEGRQFLGGFYGKASLRDPFVQGCSVGLDVNDCPAGAGPIGPDVVSVYHSVSVRSAPPTNKSNDGLNAIRANVQGEG